LARRCVFVASVVNTNRNFSATVADKVEIAGEFVLVFNKFRPTIAFERGRSMRRARDERTTGKSKKAPERVMGRQIVRRFAARRQADGLAADVAELFQNLAKGLFDAYRPELHYMRGPGPKWHAKHDPAPAAYDAMPALARVRAKR
jgi:hypothetical protein